MRKLPQLSLAVVACLALGIAAIMTVDANDSRAAAKKIQVVSLSKRVEKVLRRAGVAGSTLNLVGTPLASVSLYQAPWAQGGKCISSVDLSGVPDGADCGPNIFTQDDPGYASAGPLAYTLTGKPGTSLVPPHTLSIRQVYGVATTTVKAARLIGPTSGVTKLALKAGAPGYVVFGSSNPPPDGDVVELLDGNGTILQKIQIAP